MHFGLVNNFYFPLLIQKHTSKFFVEIIVRDVMLRESRDRLLWSISLSLHSCHCMMQTFHCHVGCFVEWKIKKNNGQTFYTENFIRDQWSLTSIVGIELERITDMLLCMIWMPSSSYSDAGSLCYSIRQLLVSADVWQETKQKERKSGLIHWRTHATLVAGCSSIMIKWFSIFVFNFFDSPADQRTLVLKIITMSNKRVIQKRSKIPIWCCCTQVG